MSDAFWNNLPATLLAFGALVATILLHFRAATKTELAENTKLTKETKEKLTNGLADSVEEIHKATNGMKEELVRATGALEFAKGLAAGKVIGEEKAKEKGS